MSDGLESPLAYFLAVAEHTSFSAASRAIHVSQPALSVAVRRLEERIGTPLLHRESRGVSLTRAGALLRERALEARSILGAAQEEIHALGGEARGRYRLGLHESLGAYFLPGFMGDFIARYPAIELDLFNASSVNVERAVIEREVDVGLVVNASRHPDSVVRELFIDVVLPVVSPRLVRDGVSAREVLASHPLLVVPGIVQTESVLMALHREGLTSPQSIRCSSMELVKNLVIDGTGVGILPWRVATHGDGGSRIQILDSSLPNYRDSISLVRRADAPMTHALRLLLDALLERGERVESLPAMTG